MSGLYKGFIATDGKTPLEKYKGLNKFKPHLNINLKESERQKFRVTHWFFFA